MEKKIKVLVVEDDRNLGAILSDYLNAKGYEATLATDGDEGMKAYKTRSFDFCILDVMMPKKDGFTLAREIRKSDKRLPIIFLTAKAMKEDKIEGFKTGADDYITKPFSMEELLARMSAILRRVNSEPHQKSTLPVFAIGKFTFDPEMQLLALNGHQQKLTSKENELLKLLVENKNEVLDRTTALKMIWSDDSYFNSRSMDVYVAKLRKFLRDDPNVEIITVHGYGFKLRCP